MVHAVTLLVLIPGETIQVYPGDDVMPGCTLHGQQCLSPNPRSVHNGNKM